MPDLNDPFAVPTYRTSSDSVMSSSQMGLVRQRQAADPVSDAITKASQRKSDLGRAHEGLKLTRDQFLDTEGADLFVTDPMTKKRVTNPDGSFLPQMGSKIEELRARTQQRVGIIRGALTPAVAGDPTDDAKAAGSELASLEPVYTAKMQKFRRIQEQLDRVKLAGDETEVELGRLSSARLQSQYPQMGADVFSQNPMAAPAAPKPAPAAPASEVNPAVPKSPTPASLVQLQRQIRQAEQAGDTAAAQTLSQQLKTGMDGLDPERQKRVVAATKDPTFWGEFGKNAADFGASFGSGSNSLLKMAGDLYGLATGDMDNAVSRAGQYGVDYFNEMKSDDLRAAESARKAKIDAEGDELGKAWAYVKETVANPSLLSSAIAEQLPNTVGTGGAGAVARVGAEKILLKTLAKEAAKRLATKVGVRTAIATGAAMQGADVGANQYDELTAQLAEMPDAQALQIPEIAELTNRGASIDEAKIALALTQARKTGAVAGGISAAAQLLPGARTLEKTLVGGEGSRSVRGRVASAVAGAAGEAASEVIEEGGGQITKNVQARPVDPTREATAGLGETAGQALLTAGILGGAAGAANGGGGPSTAPEGKGTQVPPQSNQPAPGGVVGGTEDRAETPAVLKPFDQQFRVTFKDVNGQDAGQYFDVANEQEAIAEFQKANPGIQNFDIRSPITRPTPVEADLQSEFDAQTPSEAVNNAPEPVTQPPTPSAQPVQSPDVSVETVPGAAAEQPAVPAPLPAAEAAKPTQGPDSGAGRAPDEVAGVETRSAPAPTPNSLPISDELVPHQAPTPEGTATPDVGQTTAPQNAGVGDVSPAPTSPETLEGEKINREWTGYSPESKSLGIPRAEMPQIASEARGALTQFLKARGVDHTTEEISPADLKPTQAEYSPGKVKKAVASREEFGGQGRAILISSDNHVVDGHHQWMAALEAASDKPMRVIRLNAPIRDLLTQIKEFPSAENAKGATKTTEKKEPWQMKRDEFAESNPNADPQWKEQRRNVTHRREVELALKAGKPVGADVLADYPDLAPEPTIKDSLKVAPEPKTPATNSSEAPKSSKAEFKLPRDLAGAKPRYKESTLKFESELDKALYILAQKDPSKRDADFAREVTRQTGMTDADARKAGSLVRQEINAIAREQGDAAELTVPVIHQTSDFAPTPAPKPAPAPAAAPKTISPQPTATATGPNSSLKKPQPPAAVAGEKTTSKKPAKKAEAARPVPEPAKPAKEVRADILQKIDAAIDKTQSEDDFWEEAVKRSVKMSDYPRKNEDQQRAYIRRMARDVAREKHGTVTIKSGNTEYTVTNTKEVLAQLQRNVEAKMKPISMSGVRANTGNEGSEKVLIESYQKAKTEGEKRSAMDQLSEASLKKLGLDGQYVKLAPGVTMTKEAATALEKLRKGFTGEFEVTASNVPTGETVDPAAPRGLSFVESSADALPQRTREDLARFEATFNRGRSAEAGPVTLRVRELGAEPADSIGAAGGNTASAARLRRGLEQAFGKNIIFVEPTGNQRWAAITAKSAPKTVLVNTKAASPFMALTGHEFTHNLQAERPELYERLGNFIDEFAPMPDDYSGQKVAQGYAENKVHDEWIADVVGQRFDEPQFWKEAAAVAESRGAGAAFKQLARDAFEYLTKLGRRITMALSRKGTAPFLEEIDRIRTTIANVLVDYSTGNNMPAGAEQIQMAASTPTTTAASEAVRAKHPGAFDKIPGNHLPVEVKTADGKIIPATMYGYWDNRNVGFPLALGIGYFAEDGGITHGQLRDGDALLTEVPPPEDFGIQPSTPESPEQKKSQSPRTERSAGFLVEDIDYETRAHDVVSQEAKDFIAKHGETKAARVALDPSDRSMPGDTRTFVLRQLMDSRSKRMADPKTSPEEQESLVRELQNLSSAYNPDLRDAARQLSARQSLLSDARAGSIDQYVRETHEDQDRELTKPGKKAVDDAADAINEVKKGAVDKATKAIEPTLAEIPLTKSLWQRYRDMAAERVYNWINGETKPAEDETPMKEFTDRILAEIRSRLPKLDTGAETTTQQPSDLLREAVENKEKYAEAFSTVRDRLVEEFGANSPIVDQADMLLGDLGVKPYSKRLLDKAIKQAHDSMTTNVRELARTHYLKADRLHRNMADALVEEAGLSPARAKEVSEDLRKRMDELTAAATTRALDQLKKNADMTPRTRKVIDAISKATELNNLGALSSADLANAVAKELKLPQVKMATMKEISDIAHRIETATNQSDRSRAELDMTRTLRIARGITKTEVATSLWYANMLSGYTTQVANTLGNVMNGTIQLASVMATNPKHGAEALRGWINGFGEGFAQGKAILKSGRGSREFDARTGEAGNVLELVDYARDFPDLNKTFAAGLQKHAKLMRYVTRGMKAVDSVFYYPAREAYARVVTAKLLEGQYKGKELYTKVRDMLGVAPDQLVAAKKQAEEEGFTGIDLSLRTANIIEERRRKTSEGAQASDASERFALETTFNNEPQGWAGVLYQGLVPLTESVRPGGVPIMKMFLPFLRVPTNIFNASMNFTPQGAVRALRGMPLGVSRGTDGKFHVERKEFTKDERNRLLAQSIGGSLTMAGLAALALGAGNDEGEEPWFDITATGPDDFRKRQQLEATGWRPHSLKFGDAWVSYKDSPLLLPLSISGHVVDAVRYKKQDDELALGNKVTNAVMTAPRAIFETSMLSGLGTMMDFASGNASAKQVEGFLARTAITAAVPNLLAQIDRTFNPETREANGPLGAAGAATPFLRNTGNVKTDVLGEPVERGPMRRFGGIEGNDPLREVLRDKKVFISTPSRDTKLGNEPMDEETYRVFVQTSGERINQRLRPFVGTLRRLPAEQAERVVDKVVREERERAKNVLRSRPVAR